MTDVTKHDHAAAGYHQVYSGGLEGREIFIGPGADSGALFDMLMERLNQADVMLNMTCAGAGETFRLMSSDAQDDFFVGNQREGRGSEKHGPGMV